MLNAKYKVYL